MDNFKLFPLSIVLILIISTTNASDKVIYGNDDRLDLYEATHLPFVDTWADGTLSLVDHHFIDFLYSEDSVLLENRLLGDPSSKMCKTERFLDQPAIASCTAFLVSPDIVVTAGHCIDRFRDCQTTGFIFNYSYQTKESNPLEIFHRDLYSCKEIIARTLDAATKSDFAVVRLDRPVLNHTPLRLNTKNDINIGDKVAVLGSSNGLPLKVAANGKVRDISKKVFFTATTDSYGGNSGSPVFNQSSGDVEGILVRGEADFEMNGDCKVSKRCDENDCRGEDIVRASQFAHLIPPQDRDWEIEEYNFVAKNMPQDIPDQDDTGVSVNFEVTDPGRVHRLSLYLDMEHEFFNDIIVLLYEPGGHRAFMMWKYDPMTGHVAQWYGDKEGWNDKTLNFRGFKAKGTWTVHIADYYGSNIGKVNAVKMHLQTYK